MITFLLSIFSRISPFQIASLPLPTAVSELPKMETPFSLDHECYAESRHFLANKPLLRHIAAQLQQLKTQHPHGDDACTAFANALNDTDISAEATLDVQPLMALPDIAAIVCRECERAMPVTENGIMVGIIACRLSSRWLFSSTFVCMAEHRCQRLTGDEPCDSC